MKSVCDKILSQRDKLNVVSILNIFINIFVFHILNTICNLSIYASVDILDFDSI